jgi:glycosyltransferase involved in cell wall biosynthesis
MKTAIYSPYLDTAGGGEKYMMAIAEVCASFGKVDVLLDQRLDRIGQSTIMDNLNKMYRTNWQNIDFCKAPFDISDSAYNKYLFTKKYDYLFYLSDGSTFFSGAKNSYLHIQMPLEKYKDSLVNKFKLLSWKGVIYNSNFTLSHMKHKINLPSTVIYPPVELGEFHLGGKKNIIVNIGRFVRVKKQNVLISAFKEMIKKVPKQSWELVLMGGDVQGDAEYLNELKNLAKGLPVKILVNVSRKELIEQLSKARIYWHAMGYESKNPQDQEHFGISVVEAMASGCVPVVVNKGGLKEIVGGKYGEVWESVDELVNKTLEVIKNNPFGSQLLIGRSRMFSKETFNQELISIMNLK